MFIYINYILESLVGLFGFLQERFLMYMYDYVCACLMMLVTPEELTHVSNLDVQVACGGAEEKVWQKPFLKAGKISWRFGG